MKEYKFLVTGHRGFIGSHLYAALPDSKIGIDLKEGEDILECLPDDIRVETVFHLAALPSVEYSVRNPSYSLKHNVLGTSKVLDWSRNHGVKRFIFSSSAAVYGNGSGPTSPYGLHKMLSEKECQLYADLYGLDTVCLRYFNVYSEDQPYGGAYSTVISAWMEMIRQGRPLRVDGSGNQTRDYVHVDDVIDVNLFCAKYENKFNGMCLDVGTGEAVSLNQLKTFISLIKEIEWQQAPGRPGDVQDSIADTSELGTLGWNAKVEIYDGLARCFK